MSWLRTSVRNAAGESSQTAAAHEASPPNARSLSSSMSSVQCWEPIAVLYMTRFNQYCRRTPVSCNSVPLCCHENRQVIACNLSHKANLELQGDGCNGSPPRAATECDLWSHDAGASSAGSGPAVPRFLPHALGLRLADFVPLAAHVIDAQVCH